MAPMTAHVAASQLADRQQAAAASRTARRVLRERRDPTPVVTPVAAIDARIVLRPASWQDGAAVARLAELDEAERPQGELLLAELNGRIVAAVPMNGGRAIADPFRLTGDLVELLRSRARQLTPDQGRSHRLRAFRPRLHRA